MKIKVGKRFFIRMFLSHGLEMGKLLLVSMRGFSWCCGLWLLGECIGQKFLSSCEGKDGRGRK